jgi:hypothetical protein
MHGRLRASARLRAALLAALFGGLFLIVPALAGTTDINDFNLTETTSTYGGGTGTQFHVTTGGSIVQYRWLDSPVKSTVISANTCGDAAMLGQASYGVSDTTYRTIWASGYSQACFILRGRTQPGQGSMSLYDGRINR